MSKGRLPDMAVRVVHLEDPPGSGLAACCGLPFDDPPGNGPLWACTGCTNAALHPRETLRDWQKDLLSFDEDGLTLPQVVADLLGVKSVNLRPERDEHGHAISEDRRWRVQYFGGTYGGTLQETFDSQRHEDPAPTATEDDPYQNLGAHARQSDNGTHTFDPSCKFCLRLYWEDQKGEEQDRDLAYSHGYGDGLLAATRAAPDKTLRKAVESAIGLADAIPHSVDVEQAGMQAEVVIETLRAALSAPAPTAHARGRQRLFAGLHAQIEALPPHGSMADAIDKQDVLGVLVLAERDSIIADGAREARAAPAPTVDAATLDVERLGKALRVVFVADAETGEPPSDETLRGFARDVLAALRASAPGDKP